MGPGFCGLSGSDDSWPKASEGRLHEGTARGKMVGEVRALLKRIRDNLRSGKDPYDNVYPWQWWPPK